MESTDRLTEEKQTLIHAHGVLRGVRPKTWPKQAASVLFQLRNNNSLRNNRTKKLSFRCLVGDKSKQNLGLGSKLRK